MPSNTVGKIQFLNGSPDAFPHVAPLLDCYSTAGPTVHSFPPLPAASVNTCLNPSTQHNVVQQGEREEGETPSSCCLVFTPGYHVIAKASYYLQDFFPLLLLSNVVVRRRKAQSRVRSVAIKVKACFIGTGSFLVLLVLCSSRDFS